MQESFKGAQGESAKSLDELVAGVSRLVSPPEIVFSLHEAIASPHASWQSLADVVCRDPNLSASLLKMANSAGRGGCRVDTLSRAASLIGMQGLYDLALGLSAMNGFQSLSSGLVNVSVFWRHSLYTAIIAKHLARCANVLHPERLFVAGLLHDVGALVLDQAFPQTMREMLQVSDGDEDVLARLEHEWLGYCHAQVGARLLTQWLIPEATCRAIEYHHQPVQAEPLDIEIAILHMADWLANRSARGSYSQHGCYNALADPVVWGVAGLNEDVVEGLWPQIDAEFEATAKVLKIKAV